MKLLIVALASSATYYGLKATEVPHLRRTILDLLHERHDLRRIVRKQNMQIVLHRIRADKA